MQCVGNIYVYNEWYFYKEMDEYVVMYINDKPIHSQSASDHARDLGRVLEIPRENKLYVNAEKSAFSLRKLEF